MPACNCLSRTAPCAQVSVKLHDARYVAVQFPNQDNIVLQGLRTAGNRRVQCGARRHNKLTVRRARVYVRQSWNWREHLFDSWLALISYISSLGGGSACKQQGSAHRVQHKPRTCCGPGSLGRAENARNSPPRCRGRTPWTRSRSDAARPGTRTSRPPAPVSCCRSLPPRKPARRRARAAPCPRRRAIAAATCCTSPALVRTLVTGGAALGVRAPPSVACRRRGWRPLRCATWRTSCTKNARRQR